ncbi:hypothetical protein RRF57_006186 [Xylaria bambusicola]|uniref:SprT-like domain-containing protein n=1 Tax=Xylaria bambusicola TaxID=326684 RepID=A0AAN7Z9P8_9PEZI
MMKFFDEFFFFGSVTLRIRFLILSVFPSEANEIGSCGHIGTQPPIFDILLHIMRGSQLATLPELVDTLFHEMIHAFLSSFTCYCPKCFRNDHNTVGMRTTSHGPTFRALSYAGMRYLGKWNLALDEVFKARSSGTYIDKPCLIREQRSIEAARQSDPLEHKLMLPYIKNPSPRLLI